MKFFKYCQKICWTVCSQFSFEPHLITQYNYKTTVAAWRKEFCFGNSSDGKFLRKCLGRLSLSKFVSVIEIFAVGIHNPKYTEAYLESRRTSTMKLLQKQLTAKSDMALCNKTLGNKKLMAEKGLKYFSYSLHNVHCLSKIHKNVEKVQWS